MNILDFDNWIKTNEGFKADINNDENENEENHIKKDELQVETPSKNNDTIYVVSNDSVTKKVVSKDDKGNIIDQNQEEEVKEKELKKILYLR